MDAVLQRTDNEYKQAADYLKKYVADSGLEITVSRLDIKKTLEHFQRTYAPEVLESLDDSTILPNIFYTVGDNTEALCCYIEMNKECRSYFGSISGGSAYKFGLFQKKETGKWTTGSPQKSQDLTEEEALVQGKRIRDALVKGAKLIRQTELPDLSAYERLDAELRMILGNQMYNWSWIHKYFSMICNDKLSGFHSDEWQYFVLRTLQIKPGGSYYVRSGQISMVQNCAGWYYRELFDVIENRFGKPRQFLRLGSEGKEGNYASEWQKKGVVGIGWTELGDLSGYEKDKRLTKEIIQNRLKELYYKDDNKTSSRKAGEIIRFYNAGKDTVFVVMNGERLIALAECEGDYVYNPNVEMGHLKHAKWKKVFAENEKLPGKNEGKLTTCSSIVNDENLQFLYERFYYGGDIGGGNNPDNKISEGVFERIEVGAKCMIDKNTILYGPPGTGKTYNSVIYAVAICDGKSIDDVKKNDYKYVLARYRELRKSGRIAFTTFHQSYGYEEFIEGIHPVMTEDKISGGLEYEICDGIFKKLCNEARTPESADIDHNAAIWFVRLKGPEKNDLKEECFQDGEIRFEGPEEPGKEFAWVHERLMKMKSGDFVISYGGKSTIADGIGIIEGDVPYYDTSKTSYRWTHKVRWMLKDVSIDVKEINGGRYLPNFEISGMSHMRLSDLLTVVENNGGMKFGSNDKPYVFIIDEINRGNISKIFGELITLIEAKKRAGAEEEMEAVLPYSGEAFSVPDNVYILGTMNTADRSIALMDTALRRRFEFVEMMPDSDVLKDLAADIVQDDGKELNIAEMLDVINKRIEYLYDREHTIGHAFFTRLADDPTIERLASIFEKNVIPLLQEYFYEDYEKIQLVLGDNEKPDEYKFILDRDIKLKDIFKGNPDIDLPEKGYTIQHEAFHKIQSYKLIGNDL